MMEPTRCPPVGPRSLPFPRCASSSLPADFPLRLHWGEQEEAGWGQLLHARWNAAFAWTRSLPALLTQLTSLHLMVDVQSPHSFSHEMIDQLTQRNIVSDAVVEACTALSHVTQLTLTLRPPEPRLQRDVRLDLSRHAWPMDLPLWLDSFSNLRFLFLDMCYCVDGHLYMLLASPLHRFMPWRRRVECLGLSLRYSSLIAAARYWTPQCWPALKECYVGLSPWLDGREQYGGETWESKDEAVEEALMRRVIGERVWVSRAQLMRHRVDVQCRRRH